MTTKKNIVMSFKPYTEKIKKKIGICSNLGRIRIRIQNRTRTQIHHPGSGSADPDPHQNDTDPKHWLLFPTILNNHIQETRTHRILT